MKASFEETFRYELLDTHDRLVSTLNGVQDGGTLDFSVSADIRGSGSIDLSKLSNIDWLHSRVRVWYNDKPLITAIPKVPAEAYDDTETTMQVDLYDKTMILTDDNFGGTYSVAAGTNIINKVIEVIQSTGETKVAIPTSAATLANGMVWEANTPKLRIVNDLLAAANYFGIYCDGMGYYRSTSYVAPAYRAVLYNFVDDANGMYLPAFVRNYDPFSVPNKFICVGKTAGDVEALTKTATDTDPASPYSFPSRPWQTITQTDVDYVDEANLQAIADRKLIDARQVSETFEIRHPDLEFGLNEVVTFTNKKLGKVVKAVCQKQTWTLTVGGLIQSTIRTLV